MLKTNLAYPLGHIAINIILELHQRLQPIYTKFIDVNASEFWHTYYRTRTYKR